MSFFKGFVGIVLLLLIPSCKVPLSPGYIFQSKPALQDFESKYYYGITSRNDVLYEMGYPSFEIDNKVYYISLSGYKRAFFKANLESYAGVEFAFNAKGKLDSIRIIENDDLKSLDFTEIPRTKSDKEKDDFINIQQFYLTN